MHAKNICDSDPEVIRAIKELPEQSAIAEALRQSRRGQHK